MYNFVDTVSKQSSTELPSEALCINGVYIENEIDGYRTLSVEGRELLESEVGNIQIGNQDGRRYRQKRDEVRTIQINYQMIPAYANHPLVQKAVKELEGYLPKIQKGAKHRNTPER